MTDAENLAARMRDMIRAGEYGSPRYLELKRELLGLMRPPGFWDRPAPAPDPANVECVPPHIARLIRVHLGRLELIQGELQVPGLDLAELKTLCDEHSGRLREIARLYGMCS